MDSLPFGNQWVGRMKTQNDDQRRIHGCKKMRREIFPFSRIIVFVTRNYIISNFREREVLSFLYLEMGGAEYAEMSVYEDGCR